MARRFGGRYSPDAGPQTGRKNAPGAPERPGTQDMPPRGAYHGAQVDPAGARANALFLPAIPLVFLSLNDGALGLALGLAAAGLLTLAAFLLREGLRAEAAYRARKVARRPAFPRKIAASLLTGLGVALAAWRTEPGLLAPLIYGGAALVLHGLAFGIDPMRDKGTEGIDRFQQDRVARVVAEAERALAAMTEAARRAGDRRIEARVEAFQRTARALFRTVEEDPSDLTGARRYMTVYLGGARDATVKFADLYARRPDPEARADYLALLDDLERNYAAHTERMLRNDRSDLNVEIEVLRDRLQREGVRPE